MPNPPVLILGGADNALAVARSLSRYGVEVAVSTGMDEGVRWSRHYRVGRFPPHGTPLAQYWEDLLLRRQEFSGSIVLACSDEAIEFLCNHHAELRTNYRLEENIPELQLELLDKRRTIVLAERAGLNVPWHVWKAKLSDADAAAARYPLLIKPIHSHHYYKVFGSKLRLVNNDAELREHLREVEAANLAVMLCEFIPGEDDRLCSYYTYIDSNGKFLFDFTKKIIRRDPKHFGLGCYHITEWQPDVAEEGRKFLLNIGFRGLANVEFKRDPRDGKLKIIECNPRFTAAQQLLVTAGVDTARIVYDVLANRPPPVSGTFAEHKRLLYPLRDFNGFRRRRARGELSLREWLGSVAYRQTFPQFQWLDPLPAMVLFARWWSRVLRKRLGQHRTMRA